jgi:hypothetical protein
MSESSTGNSLTTSPMRKRGRPKKDTLPKSLRRRLGLMELVVPGMSQAILQEALSSNGLTVERLVGKVSEKLEAKRWFNAAQGDGKSEAIVAEDNDAQLRAADLAIQLQERAGMMPATVPDGQGVGTRARVRLVQIDPDGTERAIEIG